MPILASAVLAMVVAFAAAAAPSSALDRGARRALIGDLIRQLRARYVLPDSVPRIAARLESRLRAGAYDRAATPAAFGAAVTEDLRGFDRHFDLHPEPALQQKLLAAGSDTSAVLPEIPISDDSLAVLRRQNFGVRRVALLPGNVGHLELHALMDLRLAQPTMSAAMGLMAHADAVILDVREVPGGYGNTVRFVASAFFGPDSVELLAADDRELGTTVHTWTDTAVPHRLTGPDLFVLTSPSTASAAEALAFALRRTGRATLVGERTQGAAHVGGWVPLSRGFVVFVPNTRAYDPRTNENWERVGITPDIAVPASRALAAAHLEAVRRLERRTTDPRRKRVYQWLIPLLQADAAPPAVDSTGFDRYAGAYERITIRADRGELRFTGASGVPQRLVPLAAHLFRLEDDRFAPEHQIRVRFVPDERGTIGRLELLVEDGRVITRKRI